MYFTLQIFIWYEVSTLVLKKLKSSECDGMLSGN